MGTLPLTTDPAGSDDRTSTAVAPAGRWPGWSYDLVAVAGLLALFFVLHDVTSVLRAPYWLDEAWVALSVRFPLSDLPTVTASTPWGFSFLLRLLPDNDLRVLPLVFHLIGVVAAYTLGRQLSTGRTAMARLAGIGCAMAVLLLPVQQVRHDLKQYSADAAVTLILLCLVSWTENGWTGDSRRTQRRRLGIIVAVTTVATLISSVTAVAAACAFGGLLVAAGSRRDWRRTADTAVAAALAGAITLAAILGTAERGRTPALKDYWADYFPSLGELPRYLGERITDLSPVMGMAAVGWAVFFVLGVLTLLRWGRGATAAAIVLLPVTAVVLGLARVYPLLDVRTSHYLLVTVAAVAGLGLVGAASWLAGLATRWSPRVPVAGAAVITLIGLATFAGHNHQWYRFDGAGYPTPQAMEDTRTAADYVAAHRGPDDVVVLSQLARYGFAFYSDHEPVDLITPYPTAIGWIVDFPQRAGIVSIDGRTAADIRPRLATAVSLATRRGPAARIWLVRSHLVADEQAAWQQALVGYHLQRVTDGVDPVYLLSPQA